MIILVYLWILIHVCFVGRLDAFTPPSTQPLRYINFDVTSQFILDQTRDTILAIVIPQSLPDTASSVMASGASGFIAGAVVSIVAVADGNKNFNDTALVYAGTTGFYFATRSSVDIIGEIIGMSTPIVDALAIVVPIIVSEFFKLRARAINEQQTRVGKGPTMYELMRFARPRMLDLMRFRDSEKNDDSKKVKMRMLGRVTALELISDIAKWLSFSTVFPFIGGEPLIASAEAGATAGLIAQLIRENQDASVSMEESSILSRQLRCLRAGLEGSFQFLTYQFCRNYIFGEFLFQ